jgi:hypothetical protein
MQGVRVRLPLGALATAPHARSLQTVSHRFTEPRIAGSTPAPSAPSLSGGVAKRYVLASATCAVAVSASGPAARSRPSGGRPRRFESCLADCTERQADGRRQPPRKRPSSDALRVRLPLFPPAVRGSTNGRSPVFETEGEGSTPSPRAGDAHRLPRYANRPSGAA